MIPFLLFGCDKGGYDVDVSAIDLEIELVRFEDQLFALSGESYENDYQKIYESDPLITEAVVEQILGAGLASNPRYSLLKRFTGDTALLQVVKDVQAKYNDVGFIKQELNKAFKHVKYHFPNDTMPVKAYTLVTGFAGPGFTYEGVLGISLDWYMGADYKYYHPQMMPRYMQRRMTPDYIVPQVVKGYFTNKYPSNSNTDGTLLSEMIYYGKMLEYTKMAMPQLPDSIIIEYTAKNLKWCEMNEVQIFSHFVEEKLWYSTEQSQTSKYLTDGPYTVAGEIGRGSAPRFGWWVGWNIVRNYLKNEGMDDLEGFYSNTDAKDIFKKSKYKP